MLKSARSLFSVMSTTTTPNKVDGATTPTATVVVVDGEGRIDDNEGPRAALGDVDNLDDFIVRHGEYTITCCASTEPTNGNGNGNGNDDNHNDENVADPVDAETGGALKGRKYAYDLEVDPLDNDKASSIRMLSMARPHMRAFWYANMANRATIFMWFSAVPLYDQIQRSLNLTKEQLWTSSIVVVLGVLVSRLITGVLCDRYGARLPITALLLLAAVPTALQGVVTSATGLYLTRFFVGMGGGVYVGATFWMDCMFKKERLGRIHGFTGGTGIAMVAGQATVRIVLFPVLEQLLGSAELAWRSCFCFISLGAIIIALPLMCLTDDTPRGNYAKLKKQRNNPEEEEGSVPDNVSHWKNLKEGLTNVNVLILCVQHACNLGVEIVACNALNLYFMEEFHVGASRAIFLVACFSGSNQFARTMGGKLSDVLQRRRGLAGRLRLQFIHLFLAGVLLTCFAFADDNLLQACSVLTLAAFFVYFSQASTNALTPYLSPDSNSMITGLVGASGVAGSIGFGFIFRDYQYKDAFALTGAILTLSSLLTLFMHAPGYGYLLFRTTDKDYTEQLKSDRGAKGLKSTERTQGTTSVRSDSENEGADDDDESDDSSSVSAVEELDSDIESQGSQLVAAEEEDEQEQK